MGPRSQRRYVRDYPPQTGLDAPSDRARCPGAVRRLLFRFDWLARSLRARLDRAQEKVGHVVAEPDHRRLVFARRTLLARGPIGASRDAGARPALGARGGALARRAFGVVAARIGAALGMLGGALRAVDRRWPTGWRAGRPTAGRTLARRPFVIGRQRGALLPVDLARDELLDLVDRLPVGVLH